ncbi:heat-shock protein HtpX [candidate division WOR_3 bacterium SM23_42]|uniref:Protease HtpX homolog n=1 Tax=candidate division WOR_3 bacterium SM23_42 TaxID=1703779 RepID=A0A0S8FRJ9_UNCW3|nr:MAG: heat-shock protein HtpX [candidate division WOR_3 bacterium SM23_42]
MRETLYSLIAANKRKTFLFIVITSLFLGVLGYALVQVLDWGIGGYIFFALFIVFYNIFLYYNSDKIALKATGSVPADPEEFRMLHNVVEEVSIAAGTPKPKVYITPSPAPNAFATGRNPQNASMAVTTGLLEIMNRQELQGVVAHEISHIRNYDMLLMTVVAAIGGLIILLRDFFLRSMLWGGRRRDRRSGGNAGLILLVVGLVLAVIAPIFVALIRAAISRQREYLADASGAYITRYPHGLAQALVKLRDAGQKMKRASDANAHLFIANPFGKDRRDVASMFATHPPIDKRIERLNKLVV